MDLDPALITAAGTVATVTLTEAVGFLRDQVSVLLQRRRDKATAVITSELLDGPLELVAVSEEVLETHRPGLQHLWHELGPQPGDTEKPEDEVRARLDELRAELESVVGRHITFAGEDRPRTGSPLVPERYEGQRTFTVIGERNVTIGGDHHGQISVGS
jgi:hypothetical protein